MMAIENDIRTSKSMYKDSNLLVLLVDLAL